MAKLCLWKHDINSRKFEIFFWSRTVHCTNGCILWLGHCHDGYGYQRVGGKLWRTHRIAWVIANGKIPKGLWVLHKCDNRPCCNPDHLFLGDSDANVADRVAKSRSKGGGKNHDGEHNGGAKLSRQQVTEIRRIYSQGGISQRTVAKQFGVSYIQIGLIVRGISWPDQDFTLIIRCLRNGGGVWGRPPENKPQNTDLCRGVNPPRLRSPKKQKVESIKTSRK